MKIENSLPKRVRAALYIRVSTEEQALHGLSIEAQTEALDAWAEKNHAQVVGHYTDAGISARKPAAKRPELQRLLRDVQAGKVDQVVFTKLDRWFRNIAEYYKVQEVLERHHVDWRTIHEDYDTSTSSGRLKVNIMLSVAQDEADRTSERLKVVFDSKRGRNEFLGGSPPLGFRQEGKQLVVDEEEAELVRWIFNQYIATRSKRAVIRALMDQYGIVRSTCGLTKLLSNPRYIGEERGVSSSCEPIIDPSTFTLAQQILQQRAQRNGAVSPNRVYLFTGLVFCAECGGRLASHTVDNKYTYYHCSTRNKRWSCSHSRRTSEAKLESWLLTNLLSECEAYNFELEKKRQNACQIDKASIKRKMDKLRALYLSDLIELPDYEREYTALRDALSTAQEAERQIGQLIDIAHLRDLLSAYATLDRQRQKEFWTRTISKIIITNDDDFSIIPFLS